MASVFSYSMIRRMVSVGGWHWKHVKPQLIHQRYHRSSKGMVLTIPRYYSKQLNPSPLKPASSTVNPGSSKLGPEGQNPPEKFDGGDYDEEKNEEYEQEAERRAQRIRRIKKVLSSAMFVSVLAFVGYSRRGKRQELKDNLQNVKFITDDGLFEGSERLFCEYVKPGTSAMVVLPVSIVKDGTMKKVDMFELMDGDVIVASFPKAGTTWVQEIVYLINNNLDFEDAKKQVLENRFPFLEYPYPGLATIGKMKCPRLLKTHLPYNNLPNTLGRARIIYVTRNPKDLVVSYYHFARMLTMFSFVGTFHDFLEKFQNDKLPYCPFFDHLESYVSHQDRPNVLVVTYEELSTDPEEVIKKIAMFLGKSLTDEQVQSLVEHTRFEAMASNTSVNYEHWDDIGFRKKGEAKFMRKGKVGDWKNYLTPKDNEEFNDWIAKQNKINFPFVYELPGAEPSDRNRL